MIIMTPGYVLEQTFPAYYPRIGWQSWVRDLAGSAITVSGATTPGPKDNLLRNNTYQFWEPGALPATVTFDFGEARAVDYGAIGGHTLGDESATVRLEHSPDNAAWTQFGSDVSPANNIPVLWLDTKISRRYWRVTITGAGSAPHIALIYLGEVLVMQRALAGGYRPAIWNRDNVIDGGVSDGGQVLDRTVRRRGLVPSASFERLTTGWYNGTFMPFVRSAELYPFFFAPNPVRWPDDVTLASLPENERIQAQAIGPGRGRVSVSWNMIAEGHGD